MWGRLSRLGLLLLLAVSCRQGGLPTIRTVDDLGRPVALPGDIRRIVTLAPNLTEIVAFLGAGDRIVGTDDASNQPPLVRHLPKVGGVQPNAESIAALAPDVILASSSVSPAVLLRALQPLRIPLFVVRTDRLRDIALTMRSIGAILRIGRGEEMARSFERSLEVERRTRGRRPRILFLVWTRPLFVAGRQTFVDDLFVLVGAENAVPSSVHGWPQYSMEELLSSPPDLVLYPSKSLPRSELEAFFASDPRWSKIPAVREKRYVGVDEDRFTRPGPRVASAAADLNAVIDTWERER
jgi:iron complex transport system substrate-binding protein